MTKTIDNNNWGSCPGPETIYASVILVGWHRVDKQLSKEKESYCSGVETTRRFHERKLLESIFFFVYALAGVTSTNLVNRDMFL